MVVTIALLAADNDLIGQPAGVWQAVHAGRVESSQAGGGGQGEAGGGASRDIAGLGTRHVGDDRAGGALHPIQRDAGVGRFSHSRRGRGMH